MIIDYKRMIKKFNLNSQFTLYLRFIKVLNIKFMYICTGMIYAEITSMYRFIQKIGS